MALQFRKIMLSAERFESAGVFDVNGDGIPDIVSGAHWYEGPDFKRQHQIGPVAAYDEYYDDFSTIAMDINGDGRTDFITGGWWGNTLRWRENPGVTGQEWPEHIIAETGNIETTRAWDVDGDGELEIVPNTPGAPLVVYKLIRDAAGQGTGKFAAHKLRFKGRENDHQGHGLGFGDITGNGRGDFVLTNGWLEAPADPYAGEWIWHPDFNLGRAPSVPILVVDLNGDGKNELILGEGHGYGLSWWAQQVDAAGQRTWTRHAIDPYSSQYHDLQWVDIDGDGQCELITGKRFRAHPHGDQGDKDAYGWYVFKWTGEGFAKHVIDFGPIGSGKGLGIHFAVADLTGDGRLDVVAPGKDGLALYLNQGDG
ncbi:MAG: VCBS repeat-containing protein [Opitutaceae bacterium]|nr:VCBS repeat-containing protein [Opitutaceae bacterium]